jgi:hypothetical protein
VKVGVRVRVGARVYCNVRAPSLTLYRYLVQMQVSLRGARSDAYARVICDVKSKQTHTRTRTTTKQPENREHNHRTQTNKTTKHTPHKTTKHATEARSTQGNKAEGSSQLPLPDVGLRSRSLYAYFLISNMKSKLGTRHRHNCKFKSESEKRGGFGFVIALLSRFSWCVLPQGVPRAIGLGSGSGSEAPYRLRPSKKKFL